MASEEQGIVSINGMISPTLFTKTFVFFIGSNPSLSSQYSTFSTSLNLPGVPFILASFLLLSMAHDESLRIIDKLPPRVPRGVLGLTIEKQRR